MLQNLSIPPHRIQHITCITGAPPGRNKPFPLLTIDEDSYIAGAEVYSGLDFDPDAGRYCLAIGKGCSLAEGITFLIDLDHDFHSVSQGELSCLQGMEKTWKTRRRASIILQNDVWVGHGATIMAGVTLHNGCIAAANAVVTKDIPPYAIAGGNPARILGYRFDEETIAALQRIAWWDWPKETRLARRADFDLPVQAFIERCLLYKDIERKYVPPPHTPGHIPVVLFIADTGEPYPLYPDVLRQYFEKDRPRTELLIYLPKEASTPQNLGAIEAILQAYEDRDSLVTLQTGETLDERLLFQMADYFVTTRCRETVRRTCLADLCHTKILYGTDKPIFPPDLS